MFLAFDLCILCICGSLCKLWASQQRSVGGAVSGINPTFSHSVLSYGTNPTATFPHSKVSSFFGGVWCGWNHNVELVSTLYYLTYMHHMRLSACTALYVYIGWFPLQCSNRKLYYTMWWEVARLAGTGTPRWGRWGSIQSNGEVSIGWTFEALIEKGFPPRQGLESRKCGQNHIFHRKVRHVQHWASWYNILYIGL